MEGSLGLPQHTTLQGAAGSHHRSSPHPRNRKRVLPFPPHHGTKEENLIQLGPHFAVDLLLLRYAPEEQIEQHQLIQRWDQHSPAQWGQVSLTEATNAVIRPKPRLHVFGHVHGGYGRESAWNNMLLVNCAVLNEAYALTNQPTVVDLIR
jgi:hypothetical protein